MWKPEVVLYMCLRTLSTKNLHEIFQKEFHISFDRKIDHHARFDAGNGDALAASGEFKIIDHAQFSAVVDGGHLPCRSIPDGDNALFSSSSQ